MPQRSRSRSRTPSYAVGFPMAASGVLTSLDFDFQNGRYYQSGQGVDPLVLTTTSRASTAYADNLAGVWSAFLSNVPRITNKGLFVEEARTNSIRNNSMQGAVAGSPGTAPTNWTFPTFASIAPEVIGVGVENGVDYVDVRWAGTTSASSGGTIIAKFESDTQISATSGQTWTLSVFNKLVGGTTANVGQWIWALRELSGAGASLVSSTINSTPIASLLRVLLTRTLNNASTAFVNGNLVITFNNAAVIDFTIRFGWPQLELGAFATSPIRTTTAAATRAADVVTVSSFPTFGASYTLFVRATPLAPATFGSNQFLFSVSDGTGNNRLDTGRLATTGAAQGFYTAGGSGFNPLSGGVWAQGASGKFGAAQSVGAQATVFNGAAATTGVSANSPSGLNALHIGSNAAGILPADGYIERVALWPTTRLSNSDLQRITA